MVVTVCPLILWDSDSSYTAPCNHKLSSYLPKISFPKKVSSAKYCQIFSKASHASPRVSVARITGKLHGI
ncbi:hypothetical protein N7494_010115 [Penicillium frequentans]|uniref:Uncharacterized protein n=1 Tax=Penicillium frequentans TaxID=3151616 RepID=A0AAD6CU31_9EURO|nr:hypothetical protein N7494_010115 [Penicillium glabrum]